MTALTINRLAQREIGAMIDHVAGNKVLPANIRQDIVERTDGIPLFVEEMTKAVLEAEGEGEARQTVAAIPSPALAVPASLHASLMARLDRLGPAKEVAQVGAAIGREFSYALLAAVARKPEAELAIGARPSHAAGLLFRQGSPPDATYLFKHALVQDAAYGTLLREPRRALHARIGEALESQFTEIAENQPELLARHCSEAGLTEKAAGLWGKAGQRSLERSALVEAVEQLTRAIGQIAALPPTPALRREEIKLQVALITPLFHVKGLCSAGNQGRSGASTSIDRTSQGAGRASRRPTTFVLGPLRRLGRELYRRSTAMLMRELAAQFLVLAEKQGSIVPVVVAHRLMAVSLLCTGDICTSAECIPTKQIALHDPTEHRPLATRFGQDNGVAILCLSVAGLCGCSAIQRPRWRMSSSAVKAAREIGQAATLMFVLTHTALTHIGLQELRGSQRG